MPERRAGIGSNMCDVMYAIMSTVVVGMEVVAVSESDMHGAGPWSGSGMGW